MPEGLTPAAIDAFVVEAMARGDDLYHLDEGALAGLDADLVVTQDLCAVCAVDVSVVDDALAHLGCTAEVLTIDPYTLDEVLESIVTAGSRHRSRGRGRAAGRRPAAPARRRTSGGRRGGRGPRVMFLEWTDPPFAPGHWIPEMIELAGGEPLLGDPRARSRAGSTWEQVHEAEPDAGGRRAVRLRPRRLPAAGRRPGRERCAAGRRTGARRRRQRLLGPPRHPPASTASRSSPRRSAIGSSA